MGFVIGFGSTEEERERDEEQAIRDYVVRVANESGVSYFTDDFVDGVRNWLLERAAASRAEDASYKRAENFPDRYGSYHSTVIADASHVVVILSWLHTNRRHALSPDGWACISRKQVFAVHSWEDNQSRRDA